MKNQSIRYSKNFKLQVVKDLEKGRFSTINEARHHYGIKGDGTIQIWLRKFGRDDLVPKIIRIESANEVNELKRLREENKRLKTALADKVLEHEIEKTLVEMLSERCELEDLESFKKKHVMTEPIKRSLDLKDLLKGK